MRVDKNGNILWKKRFYTMMDGNFGKIIDLGNGKILAIGDRVWTTRDWMQDSHANGTWLVKFDIQDGSIDWTRTLVDTVRYDNCFPNSYAQDGIMIDSNKILLWGGITAGPDSEFPRDRFCDEDIMWLTVDSMGCFLPDCDTAELLFLPSRTSQFQKIPLSLSPNPVSDELQIGYDLRGDYQHSVAEVWDMQGRLMVRQSFGFVSESDEPLDLETGCLASMLCVSCSMAEYWLGIKW